MSFEIVEEGKAIKCLRCDLTSYHPKDVENRYCGHCSHFHEGLFGDLQLQKEIAALKGITSYKPYGFRPVIIKPGAAGCEPMFATTYQRRVRVPSDEE